MERFCLADMSPQKYWFTFNMLFIPIVDGLSFDIEDGTYEYLLASRRARVLFQHWGTIEIEGRNDVNSHLSNHWK